MRLVLLPGMDGTGDLFREFLSVLPEGVESTIIPYPLRQKLSYTETEHYVRERLPKEPFVIVAESFSGPIGVRIAAAPPKELLGLVLSATFVRFPAGFVARWLTLIFPAALFRMQPPEWFLQSCLLNGSPTELCDQVRLAIRKVAPEVLHDRMREIAQVDARTELENVKLPVLVLAGNRDRLVKGRNLDEMNALAANSKAVMLESPHMLLQAVPQKALLEIHQFVATFLP